MFSMTGSGWKDLGGAPYIGRGASASSDGEAAESLSLSRVGKTSGLSGTL